MDLAKELLDEFLEERLVFRVGQQKPNGAEVGCYLHPDGVVCLLLKGLNQLQDIHGRRLPCLGLVKRKNNRENLQSEFRIKKKKKKKKNIYFFPSDVCNSLEDIQCII